ncbi:inducible T-cell costimulator isoform X1 [Cuculus canorus]|uniref:Inducible T-cell costimulator n=1 Tax=Cuculus canorus TaxID=55661 RepID=A0A091G231_CUCCA|nr:inducible T-cell costimulator isoform X1 [Cuculus canorus]KFO75306.1 Inducible T-cell costimulator [Cuculus canorus]
MKLVAVTVCVLCFLFEVLYGADSCSSSPCKNVDQPGVSDPQVMVEFENGNFRFTFPNPQNVSEFSMTLFKGHKKKEICALHLSEEKDFPKSNVTYCQTEHSNSSTTFILKNLERKHIDIYTYCLEIFLPPPYIECRLKETYLYIQDKEDCFSLGLMSWIIIGLIMFAMIFCICYVVSCCLKNKNRQCESNSHEYNSEYMPMAAVNAAKKTRI